MLEALPGRRRTIRFELREQKREYVVTRDENVVQIHF